MKFQESLPSKLQPERLYPDNQQSAKAASVQVSEPKPGLRLVAVWGRIGNRILAPLPQGAQ